MTGMSKGADLAAGYDAIADAITMPPEFYDELTRTIGTIEGLRVLDAGCGNGYLLERLTSKQAQALFGLEQSPELCRRARARLGSRASIIRGDLQAGLPFPPASFDVVVMSELVEHLTSPVAALRNIATALRSGGTLVMAFPKAAAYPLWRLGERRFRHPLGYRLVLAEHPKQSSSRWTP